jgi:TPR repeat protein
MASMSAVAAMFLEGSASMGAVRDDVAAVRWFRAAAEAGDAQAMAVLGSLLAEGRGAPGSRPDPREAKRWTEAAADLGHEFARVNVAAMEGRRPAQPHPTIQLQVMTPQRAPPPLALVSGNGGGGGGGGGGPFAPLP